MTKEQIIKKLELYQEKSTSMEAAMSFGVAIKLVLGLDAEQGPEEPAKDWSPKEGDWVMVRDWDRQEWRIRKYVRHDPATGEIAARNLNGCMLYWKQCKPLHR